MSTKRDVALLGTDGRHRVAITPINPRVVSRLVGVLAVTAFISLANVGSSSLAASLNDAQVRNFFNTYVELEKAYDPAIAELYSDGALLRIKVLKPDGQEQHLELSGGQLKSLAKQIMAEAKARGSKTVYRDVQVSLNGNTAKIKTQRRSNVECYLDKTHTIVLLQQANGDLLIVEERYTTPAKPAC